jgi:hypothetical protein
VVGGKTLPAGTYRLSLLADDKCEGTILSSCENRISVFVHPVEIESTFAERPHLSFERVGEERFLSRIQTTTFITFACSTRSSWRRQRKHATTGPLQEVREASKSSLLGLAGGSSGTSAQIVPPPSSTHFTSPGQVTALAKNQTSGLIETFRGSDSQTQDGSLTEACVIPQSRKPFKGDILK